jgi:hypothetical protein
VISKSALVTLAIGLALLGACSARTDIATNKDQNYTREPQRLMVIEAMGTPLGSDTKTFQATLSQQIKDCHIFTNYVITPREVSDPAYASDDKAVAEWKAKRDAFIRRFHADTFLTIGETQYSLQTLYHNGSEMSQSITQIIYQLALIDVPTRKTVWKAVVTLHTGIAHMGTDPGTQLAEDIVAKLRGDGIFQHCPSPGAS